MLSSGGAAFLHLLNENIISFSMAHWMEDKLPLINYMLCMCCRLGPGIITRRVMIYGYRSGPGDDKIIYNVA